MDWGTAVAVGGMAVNLACIVVASTWAVARIQNTTTMLTVHIDHLAKSMSDLTTWLREVSATQVLHGQRIASIEGRMHMTCDES